MCANRRTPHLALRIQHGPTGSRKWVAGTGHFLVAVDEDGRIVATGALIPEGEGVGRVVRMSVARARRRRGIGRQMLYALWEAAVERGYRRLVVETTATWVDAVAFYRAHGFRPVAERSGDIHFVLDLP